MCCEPVLCVMQEGKPFPRAPSGHPSPCGSGGSGCAMLAPQSQMGKEGFHKRNLKQAEIALQTAS